MASNPLYFSTSVYSLLFSYTLSGGLVAVKMLVSLFIVVLMLWQAIKMVSRLWGPQTLERRQQRQSRLLLLSTAIAPLLLLAVLLVVKPFWVPERTLTIVTPACAVFLAQGLTQAPRRSSMPLLYGLLTTLMVVSLGNYYFDPQYAKPPYRDAAELIAREAGPRDVEVHTSDGSYLPFLQYPQPVPNYLLRGDPDARKPDPVYTVSGGQTISREEALAQDQRIWLVVALEHSIDYRLETLDWFQGQRALLQEVDAGGIRVYLLGQRDPQHATPGSG